MVKPTSEDKTTIMLNRTTKVRLTKIGSRLSLERGRDVTYDDILIFLLKKKR